MIPCLNEEATISKVIHDIRRILPQANICVFDNNSTDSSVARAEEAGAVVIREKRKGKGFVVQAMFSKVEADIYVMVDGDDTYDLTRLPEMLRMVAQDDADMVVGSRLADYTEKAFRPLHTLGNRLVASLINRFFGGCLADVMSGLRVMSKDFVKNINITASGFEVETEMTIKALKHHNIVKELDVLYRERPAGSFSKLNTYRDGILVLRTIFMIFKDYKPLLFFSICALLFFVMSVSCGSVVINEFLKTRYIRHVPLAILASGTMILSMIFFITGVILDCANRRFDEIYHFVQMKAGR
jgi:glycosyltransferase involved in cell wall biosynthesis